MLAKRLHLRLSHRRMILQSLLLLQLLPLFSMSVALTSNTSLQRFSFCTAQGLQTLAVRDGEVFSLVFSDNCPLCQADLWLPLSHNPVRLTPAIPVKLTGYKVIYALEDSTRHPQQARAPPLKNQMI